MTTEFNKGPLLPIELKMRSRLALYVAAPLLAILLSCGIGYELPTGGSGDDDGDGSGSNSRLLVLNNTSATITSFSIDATTGALTSTGEPVSAGGVPETGGADPLGDYFFSVNKTSGTLSAFAWGSDGLTSVSGSPFSAPSTPETLAFHPSGGYVFVGDASNGIHSYRIANGAITAAAGSPFTRATPKFLQIDPTGNFLFCLDNEASMQIHSYELFSSGVLNLVSTKLSGGSNPSKALGVDTTNNRTWTGTSQIRLRAYNASGTLSDTSDDEPFAVDQIELAKDGLVWYGISGSSRKVYAYSAPVGSDMIELFGSPHTIPSGTSFLYLTPDETFLFAISTDAGSVLSYSVGSTGALTENGSVSTGDAPVAAAYEESLGILYVLNRDSNDISAFSVNSSSGVLTAIAGSPFATGGTGPSVIAIRD